MTESTTSQKDSLFLQRCLQTKGNSIGIHLLTSSGVYLSTSMERPYRIKKSRALSLACCISERKKIAPKIEERFITGSPVSHIKLSIPYHLETFEISFLRLFSFSKSFFGRNALLVSPASSLLFQLLLKGLGVHILLLEIRV